MDISKIVLIFGISLLLYFAFLFLGFFLKNKNLKAQNLKKDEINTEDCEYKNLITRLSEIRLTIALLEKKYIDKL